MSEDFTASNSQTEHCKLIISTGCKSLFRLCRPWSATYEHNFGIKMIAITGEEKWLTSFLKPWLINFCLSFFFRVGMSGTLWRKCIFPPAGSSEATRGVNRFIIFHFGQIKRPNYNFWTICSRKQLHVLCELLGVRHELTRIRTRTRTNPFSRLQTSDSDTYNDTISDAPSD